MVHPLGLKVKLQEQYMYQVMAVNKQPLKKNRSAFVSEDFFSESVREDDSINNKANSTNLYPPTKGYLRDTCKSQNINPIYLTLSSPTVSFRS